MIKLDFDGYSPCKDVALIGLTSKGRAELRVTDTSKFRYEAGYEKIVIRSISKAKTVRLDGLVYDLSKVNGMEG